MLRVLYISASKEELQQEVNQALDLIQNNVRNKVVDVTAIGDAANGYTVQISYTENEDIDKKILLEGEEYNVSEN